MTYVSFPGLGIEPFHMNRIAFSLGKLDVYWYGVIITVGMILAVLYALYHARIERVKSDDIIDLALALIVFGVIGARLYYVLMKLDTYIVTGGTFWENLCDTVIGMINIPGGGLAIYGGIIGGFLAGIVVARRKHIRFPIIADIAGPSVIVGQIVGRFGNFVNVEAYGSETTLPWRMGIHTSYDYGESFIRETFVHPTFLYESLWNLVGLILITALYKKKKFHGQMFLFYMTWYGFGRMLIEGLRTDSLYIGPLRVSQWVGGITFVLGMILLILGARKAKLAVVSTGTSVQADNEPAVTAEANEDTEMNVAKETENGSTD